MVLKWFGKALLYFVFAIKHNQMVVFMKTLTEKLFQSIVLENNLLFS